MLLLFWYDGAFADRVDLDILANDFCWTSAAATADKSRICDVVEHVSEVSWRRLAWILCLLFENVHLATKRWQIAENVNEGPVIEAVMKNSAGHYDECLICKRGTHSNVIGLRHFCSLCFCVGLGTLATEMRVCYQHLIYVVHTNFSAEGRTVVVELVEPSPHQASTRLDQNYEGFGQTTDFWTAGHRKMQVGGLMGKLAPTKRTTDQTENVSGSRCNLWLLNGWSREDDIRWNDRLLKTLDYSVVAVAFLLAP